MGKTEGKMLDFEHIFMKGGMKKEHPLHILLLLYQGISQFVDFKHNLY